MKITQIRGNRLLIKPIDRPDITAAGLYIPPAFQNKQPFATIIALGHKVSEPLAVGDTIRVDTSYGSHALPDGTRIISVLDVQVVIEKNGAAK